MILCARCDAVVEHLNALLDHYQEVHGGVPKMRYPDEKPLAPDSTRIDYIRQRERRNSHRRRDQRRRGKLIGADIVDFGVAP